MKFKVDKLIFEKFIGLNIGVVIAKNVDNRKSSSEVGTSIREIEQEIRDKYSLENFYLDPKIEVWRTAYINFGAKPKEHKSSVENLYRLVLNRIDLRQINKLVDLYNFISLKHTLPVGGEDLDKINGDILLTLAITNEPPVLLLGDKESRPPHEGEVIYKDETSAICRRWNWREAERTKLTENTKHCALFIEGLSPVTKEEVENATKELERLVSQFCGGKVAHEIIDSSLQEIQL